MKFLPTEAIMAQTLDSSNSLAAEVEAVVRAVPEIVRAAQAPRGSATRELGVPQVRALIQLARADGMTMGELARRMGVSCAAATQIADQLVALGLMVRERPDWDRRVVVVRLTERAQATVREALSHRARQVEEVFGQLTEEEARGFAKGIQLLAEVLVRDLDRRGPTGARPAPAGAGE
jgi:DNA-binding MarR family transcriptional regulator